MVPSIVILRIMMSEKCGVNITKRKMHWLLSARDTGKQTKDELDGQCWSADAATCGTVTHRLALHRDALSRH
jgi:hypothetical protein